MHIHLGPSFFAWWAAAVAACFALAAVWRWSAPVREAYAWLAGQVRELVAEFVVGAVLGGVPVMALGLMVPRASSFTWFIPIVTGVTAPWWLRALRRRADARDEALMMRECCPYCGYDVRVTPDDCPECGAIRRGRYRRWKRRRVRS